MVATTELGITVVQCLMSTWQDKAPLPALLLCGGRASRARQATLDWTGLESAAAPGWDGCGCCLCRARLLTAHTTSRGGGVGCSLMQECSSLARVRVQCAAVTSALAAAADCESLRPARSALRHSTTLHTTDDFRLPASVSQSTAGTATPHTRHSFFPCHEKRRITMNVMEPTALIFWWIYISFL